MGKIDFTVKIGGEAGYGIAQSGLIFSRAASRMGLRAFVNNEYPSLIRGGHNTIQIRVRDEPSLGMAEKVNLLLALNRRAIEEHSGELAKGAVVVYDSDEVHEAPKLAGALLCPVPLLSLAKQVGGEKIMRNTVGLGACAAFCGIEMEMIEQLIHESFGKKKEDVAETNVKGARLGYAFVKEKFGEAAGKFPWKAERKKAPSRMLVSGNEAIALGALRAGCRFLAAYPMTPASAVMHYFAANERECSVVMKHVEDEIAGINMAIGAGFAGARAMVSTSGGGFSLQTEGLGLAAMTEVPVVIIEVQRPGPATGLPTRTEQADLHFVVNAHQGEFPRLVMAPGDAEECFRLTFDAFNWAERFQIPAFVLSDKYLAESLFTSEPFRQAGLKIDRGKLMGADWVAKNQPYLRYKVTPDGIAPRVLPGTPGGVHREPSDERDEKGDIDESPAVRKMQVERRMKKFAALQKQVPAPVLRGPKKAKLTFVGWGSTKGAILETMETLKGRKITTNFIQFTHLWPFPPGAEKMLRGQKRLVLVEGNSTAQLGQLIRQQTGMEIKETILKYDGRPISAEFVLGALGKGKKKGRRNN
jgi:2-oxoglutarate/2-oxoacid ferredoxin oxidoreductase subunit alpha